MPERNSENIKVNRGAGWYVTNYVRLSDKLCEWLSDTPACFVKKKRMEIISILSRLVANFCLVAEHAHVGDQGAGVGYCRQVGVAIHDADFSVTKTTGAGL